MLNKRAIGILVILVGVVLMVFSGYIAERVGEGRQQVESAQKKVDMGNRLFSVTPESKRAGKYIMNPFQKRIDEGKQEVGEYADLAYKLRVGGIILLVLGVVLFLIRKRG